MKKQTYISMASQLLCGLMLAAFVLVQSVQIPPVEGDQQEQSSDDAEQKEEKSIVQSSAIPHSTLQINLEFDSYLLEEVTFKEEDEKKGSLSELIFESTGKAIKVLFRKIISPNAP